MNYIQESAETAVREMLREISQKVEARLGKITLIGKDYMDDGSVIHLKVKIDGQEGTATFDFRCC